MCVQETYFGVNAEHPKEFLAEADGFELWDC
jgi:hypothetical protein